MYFDAPMLSIKEVCQFLNLSRSSVHRLISRGDLRAYTVGGSKRIFPIDIERMLRGETMLDPQDASRKQLDFF